MPPATWRPTEAGDFPPHFGTLVHPSSANASVLEAWRAMGWATCPVDGEVGSIEWWTSMRLQTGLQAVLVEGGAALHDLMLAGDGWDEIHRYTSAKCLNDGLNGPTVPSHAALVHGPATLDEDTLEVWRHPRHLDEFCQHGD